MGLSSDVAQGTLTGAATQDTVRTATATAEAHTITYVNRHASTQTLKLWVNGVADQNRITGGDITLATLEFAVVHYKLGSGDTIRAEASAATAIYWTDEMDLFT